MNYTSFDQMVWPTPDEELDHLEHLLRYGELENLSQQCCVASVIAAYRQLIELPQKRRNYVVSKLRSLDPIRSPLARAKTGRRADGIA